jgi:excisionase family DNA binding protein
LEQKAMSETAKDFLTPSELATQWRCTPHHIRNLIHAGQLRGFRVGRKTIVPRDEAQQFLQRNATGRAAAA